MVGNDCPVCDVSNDYLVMKNHETKLNSLKMLIFIKMLCVIVATPKITKETKFDDVLGAEVGKPAVLQKTVFSRPSVTSFNWSKSDNQPVFNYTNIEDETVTLTIHNTLIKDSGYRISLNISNFTQEDIGTYTLTVCNQVGCSRFSMNLTAAGPPRSPKEFQQEGEATSDTVRLSWLPNYPGGNFKQRFLLQYKLQSDSEWKNEWISDWFEYLRQRKIFHNITGLKTEHIYDIRLTAENDRPNNNLSEPVNMTVKTEKGVHLEHKESSPHTQNKRSTINQCIY